MRDKRDILNLATEQERERILYLVGELPSYFFGDLLEWSDMASELGALVETLKRRGVFLESTQTSARVVEPMVLKIAGPVFFAEDNRRKMSF